MSRNQSDSSDRMVMTCSDDVGWVNSDGQGCSDYTNLGYCYQDEVTEKGQPWSGQENNYPELNCCNCGRETKDNKQFYEAPNREYYSCTHKESHSYSSRIVEYCKQAQNKAACNDTYQNRDAHCDWIEGPQHHLKLNTATPDQDWFEKVETRFNLRPTLEVYHQTFDECIILCDRQPWCRSFDYKRGAGAGDDNCNLYDKAEVDLRAKVVDKHFIHNKDYVFYEKFDVAPGSTGDFASRCTHIEKMRGDYEVVQFCEHLPLADCDLHENCRYSFDMAPSTKPGVCTHKDKYRNDYNAVNQCRELLYRECYGRKKCKQNFDEAPNDTVGQCTHKNEFRNQLQKVEHCKPLDIEDCQLAENSFCQYNFNPKLPRPVKPAKKVDRCTHQLKYKNDMKIVENCKVLGETQCKKYFVCHWTGVYTAQEMMQLENGTMHNQKFGRGMSIFTLLLVIILIGFIFGIIFALIYRKYKVRNPSKQELVEEEELDKVDIPLDQLDLPADDRSGERPSHVQFNSSAKLNKDGSPGENLEAADVKVEDIDVSVENV